MKYPFGPSWLRSCLLLANVVLCVQCGSSSSDGATNTGGTSSGGSNAGGSAQAGEQASAGAPITAIPGAPGCGLGSNAAFCDSFDAPSSTSNRAGELDGKLWSGARVQPQFPTNSGLAVGIMKATIPSCRSGIPAEVFPDQDALICDPNDAIASNHLLVAVAAQNYGENSYRIRQPFDFEGRTGKVVFDADGSTEPLLGWVSLDITEDPIPGPGFDTGVGNNEGSQIPRSALEIQLQNKCDGQATVPSVAVQYVVTYNDYKGEFIAPPSKVCVTTKAGNLNHFELNVSKNKVEVYGSNYSDDGHTFSEPQLMFSTPVTLSFTRGYVQITTHNHATLKYSPNNALDSWVATWDNVGFDGPVIADTREYSVPDALVQGKNFDMHPVVNVGYRVPDVADGPSQVLHLTGVDLSGMSSARLSLSGYYLFADVPQDQRLAATQKYTLKYRFNGGTWRDRQLTLAEATIINGLSQGEVAEMIDVPFTDLVDGDNTLEFVTANVPQNYPPAVSNIDLILAK